MSAAYSVHARDLPPGDQLPYGNRVVRPLLWPNGDVDVKVVGANGGRERFRHKPEEWVTIMLDTEDGQGAPEG